MNTLARLVAWQRSGGSAAPTWSDAQARLPEDLLDVLRVANGDERALAVAISITGEKRATLQSAALRFIREGLLARDASHYRKLGVEADAPIARIRKHYRELIAIFHPDRLHDDAPAGDAERATIVNEAYNVLKRPHARAAYDRERASTAPATAQPAPAPVREARSAPPPAPRAGRRWHWKRERDPGALRVWLRSRSPATLKRMAFGAVLAAAVIVVVAANVREAPFLAMTPQVRPGPDAGRGDDAGTVARETPLASLVARNGASAPRLPAAASGHAGGDAARTPEAGPAPVALPQREVVPAPMYGPVVATAGTRDAGDAAAPAPPPPTAPLSPQTRAPDAVAQAVPPARAVPAAPVPPPSIAVVAEVSVPTAPARVPDRAPAESPPAGAGAAPPPSERVDVAAAGRGAVDARPALAAPSATDVDALVARFAVAFDNGDLPAMLALVDPDAALDDRIAFTFANFGRVFRETASRRIELRIVQRSTAQDGARVELAARTTLHGRDAIVRAANGDLLLVMRNRGGVPMITDVRYRERVST